MTQPAGICVAPRLAVASRSDTDSSLEAPRNIGAKRKVTLAMNSTRTQEKAQQQTLTIRISEGLRGFLERSKYVISSNRGESVSMSEVARILLESAKDDRLDFRLEVAELQQSPTASLEYGEFWLPGPILVGPWPPHCYFLDEANEDLGFASAFAEDACRLPRITQDRANLAAGIQERLARNAL